MEIWPTIEICEGKCVRLSLGDTRTLKVYGHTASDMALRWAAEGADGIHIIDLDGAHHGVRKNFGTIEKIAEQVDIPLQVGGGVRTHEDIEQFLEIGIKRIVIGTRALKDPQWFVDATGRYANCLLAGLDSRGGFATTDGRQSTSKVSVVNFASSLAELPVAGFAYSDVLRGNQLEGPNFSAIKEMRQSLGNRLFAAGGISSVEDVKRLAGLGVDGCIIGRALYTGSLTLEQALLSATENVPSI